MCKHIGGETNKQTHRVFRVVLDIRYSLLFMILSSTFADFLCGGCGHSEDHAGSSRAKPSVVSCWGYISMAARCLTEGARLQMPPKMLR